MSILMLFGQQVYKITLRTKPSMYITGSNRVNIIFQIQRNYSSIIIKYFGRMVAIWHIKEIITILYSIWVKKLNIEIKHYIAKKKNKIKRQLANWEI